MTFRCRLATLLLASLAANLLPAAAPAQTPLPPKKEILRLADTERAFAAASAAEGMRAAFLEYFAPDGVNFTPHPVNTRDSINARPAPAAKPPITLGWCPLFGDVSNAGDLGYTTGPYTLTDSRENNKVVGHGYYFSVWKRQPDGTWRVAVDYGIETPSPAVAKSAVKFQPSHWVGSQVRAAPHTTQNALAARDRAFAESAALRDGPLAAYREFTSWDSETRLYRDQHDPIVGRAAITAYLANSPDRVNVLSMAAGIAASGDLAYTYGKWDAVGEPLKGGYYVRIWRLIKNDWRVVLEVMNPLPAE